MVGEKEGGGKGAAPPIGCLSTKSGAGFEGRGRGWAGGCWGAEVGVIGRFAGSPPGSHFVAVPAVVPGLGGGAGGTPCPPRPGGAVRGAGGRVGLHATVGNVLPRPPRLPIDRDKHANESLCMSLAYRQIGGGGAACVRTAACFNATPKQPLLVSPASGTCGSPAPPPRAAGPPSPPPAPPRPAETPAGLPRQVPGSSSPARGCRARGHAGINKAKPRAALFWGYFCVFTYFCVLSPCAGEGSGRGGCLIVQPPPLAAPLRRRL